MKFYKKLKYKINIIFYYFLKELKMSSSKLTPPATDAERAEVCELLGTPASDISESNMCKHIKMLRASKAETVKQSSNWNYSDKPTSSLKCPSTSQPRCLGIYTATDGKTYRLCDRVHQGPSQFQVTESTDLQLCHLNELQNYKLIETARAFFGRALAKGSYAEQLILRGKDQLTVSDREKAIAAVEEQILCQSMSGASMESADMEDGSRSQRSVTPAFRVVKEEPRKPSGTKTPPPERKYKKK